MLRIKSYELIVNFFLSDGFPVFEDLTFDFPNLENAVPESLSFLDTQVSKLPMYLPINIAVLQCVRYSYHFHLQLLPVIWYMPPYV